MPHQKPLCDLHSDLAQLFREAHTTIAYFIAEILAYLHPEHSFDLTTLAELIAQSRIENGVHFPTDVSAGKFLGQLLAGHYVDDGGRLPKYKLKKDRKKITSNDFFSVILSSFSINFILFSF